MAVESCVATRESFEHGSICVRLHRPFIDSDHMNIDSRGQCERSSTPDSLKNQTDTNKTPHCVYTQKRNMQHCYTLAMLAKTCLQLVKKTDCHSHGDVDLSKSL